LAESYGFEIIRGKARFESPHVLKVEDRSINARFYIIATGANPAVPQLPGLVESGYLTSTTAMELLEIPERLITIGGGFVGLEQSQLFARLGSRVTIIGRLTPRAEPELASRLHQIMVEEGVTVISGRATSVQQLGETKAVQTDVGTTVEGDAILVATGRTARIDGLDLEDAGVEVDGRGFIKVDDSLRTTNSKILAVGDVSGGPQFVYVAGAEGHLAAHNALTNSFDSVDYTGLPEVTFSDPQLASAGLTEAQALAKGYDCDCRLLGFDNVPRGLVSHDTRGAIKRTLGHRISRPAKPCVWWPNPSPPRLTSCRVVHRERTVSIHATAGEGT
jgi:mercuric reductase